MTIELIPVIEIGYGNQGVTTPDKYPYWDNSEIWDAYNEESYRRAGFKDKFIPYQKGFSIYRLPNITEDNLTKLIIDHTQEMREGKYERQQACTFFGGYVLRVNDQDKYFPQCCGGLSDITYWERLSDGQASQYEGHPEPLIKFDNNNITFDFSVDEYDERFQPTPPEITLTIDRLILKKAIENVKIELKIFEKRLNEINTKTELNIDNIGGLLIWDNANYE
jgi:hypothetical protein